MENTQIAKTNHICLLIITGILLSAFLNYTKGIFIPFVISFFIYVSLLPLSEILQNKFKLPKLLAFFILGVGFVTIFITGTVFITQSVGDFVQGLSQYKNQTVVFMNKLNVYLTEIGIPLDTKNIQESVLELPIATMVKKTSGGIMNLVSNFTLIFIISLFLITGEEMPKRKVPSPLIKDIKEKISKYIATKMLTSFSTAVLIGVIFLIFGVDLALLFALLTFVFNFIPSVGSIIATLLPVPVLLLQFGLNIKFILVLGLCGVVQFLIGNVIEPKIMGESMDLHPITILLFLIFWGMVWGIPGMFLAVPITAILKIVLSKMESTKGLSDLLAGKI